MKIALLQNRRTVLIATAILFYCALYFSARYNGLLIHRMSFSGLTDPPLRHHHWVEDAEPLKPFLPIVPEASHFMFTPLRWLESAFWHCYPRKYYLHIGYIAEGNEIRLPDENGE